MTTHRNAGILLEDLDVNVKIKLAGLWVALMFFYLYRDVLGFMEPGHVDDLLAGELAGVQMTQAVLLGSAVLMAIPSVMVFLSLALQAQANRWANIILGLVHIGILLATFFVGEISALYAFYAMVELLLMVLIVWHAWKWPKLEEAEVIPWGRSTLSCVEAGPDARRYRSLAITAATRKPSTTGTSAAPST